MTRERSPLITALLDRQQELHLKWMSELRQAGSGKDRRISDADLEAQTGEFLRNREAGRACADDDDVGAQFRVVRNRPPVDQHGRPAVALRFSDSRMEST